MKGATRAVNKVRWSSGWKSRPGNGSFLIVLIRRREKTKYGRLLLFGAALPRLRAKVERHLARRGLPRKKVLALIVRLLERTLIRVGNREYARQHRSFGLTTMQDRHVDIDGATMRFEFRGKSGKWQSVRITDRRLASLVRRCQEMPGQELFQYDDTESGRQSGGGGDVPTGSDVYIGIYP